jgi:hypothetical protein
MHRSLLFPLAVCASLNACGLAFAQQPSQFSCPAGQTLMHSVDASGKPYTWCYAGAGGGRPMPHDFTMKGAIQMCVRDSDCQGGIFRCENGICGRSNMVCKKDTDCKESEICDAKQKRCVDKGGNY